MAQLIKCPHCNKFIDKNSNICPKCSKPLVDNVFKEDAVKPVDNDQETYESGNRKQIIRNEEISSPTVRVQQREEVPAYHQPNPTYVPSTDDYEEEINTTQNIEEDPDTNSRFEAEEEVRENKRSATHKREDDISSKKELEAFYASINKSSKEDDEEDDESYSDEDDESEDEIEKEESTGMKLASIAGNLASNFVNNSKAMIGMAKSKGDNQSEDEDDEQSSPRNIISREQKKVVKEKTSKKTYNANYDGYYDFVTAEIDARTEHVSTEMVIKTIAFIAIVIATVVGMINFI